MRKPIEEMTDHEFERSWWHTLQTYRGMLQLQDRTQDAIEARIDDLSAENREGFEKSKLRQAHAWEGLEHDYSLYLKWSARLPIGGDVS